MDHDVIAAALAEDVGDGDVTTEATIPAGARARATITQKAPGAVYGLDVAEAVFRRLDPEVRAERLLLDNMTPDELRHAVDHVAGRAKLEASGGVTFETLKQIADTGVDWVSVGSLTHSAPALDLSLLLEPLT